MIYLFEFSSANHTLITEGLFFYKCNIHYRYGLFTLRGNERGTGTGNGTGKIGNNGSWSMSLFQISLNISYIPFGLCTSPVPVQCDYTMRELTQT